MARKLEVQIVGDASGLSRAFREASSGTSGFGHALHGMGKAALLVAGGGLVALGAGIKSALSAAGDFEQTLNTFQAVTSSSGASMKEVSQRAKQLGADLTLPGTSAKDAAEAMLELSKGGLSVDQTMKAAKGTLQLATAAQIGNAEAAAIQARALNAFGLAGSQAGVVADVLANAANASTGEITDMAFALQQSSAVAHSFGLSIADTATAISLMANKGIIGSDAGTSLKTMLSRLVPQTKKAAEEMKKLGITYQDSHGQILPLRNMIGQYHDKLMALTPVQRQMALYTIFGSDAQRAANIILKGGVDAWDKMHGAMLRHGTAAEIAAAKMKGFKGAIEGFKSSWETLTITLGTPLLRFATPALQKISAIVSSLDDLVSTISDMPTARLKFEVVKSAATDLLFGSSKKVPDVWSNGIAIHFRTVTTPGLVASLAKAFDGLKSNLAGIDWSGVAASVANGIRSGFQNLGSLGASLGATLGTALANVDWVAVGTKAGPGLVAALATAFTTILDPTWWASHWELAAGVAFAALGIAFTPAKLLKFIPFGEFAQGLIRGFLGPLARFGGELAGLFGRAFASAFPEITGAMTRLTSVVSGGIRSLPRVLAEGARLAVESFGRALGFLVREALDVLGRVVSAIAGRARAFAQPLELGARMAVDAVRAGLGKLAGAVTGPLATALSAIRARAASWLAAGTMFATRLIAGAREGLGKLVSAITGPIMSASNAVANLAGEFFNAAVAIGRNIVSGVLSGLGSLAGAVASKVRGAISSAISMAGGWLHGSGDFMFTKQVAGVPLARGVVEGFMLGIRDLPTGVKDAIRNALEAGKTAIENSRGLFATAWARYAGDGLRAFDAETDRLMAGIDAKTAAALARIDARLSKASAKLDATAAGVRAGADAFKATPTDSEAQIAKIRLAREETTLWDEQTAAIKALNEARASGDAQAIADAQKRLDLANEGLALHALEMKAAEERRAKDAIADLAVKTAEDRAAAKKAALEKAAASEKTHVETTAAETKKQLQARRDEERRDFEDALATLEKYFTRAGATVQGFNTKMTKLFAEHGVTFKASGAALGSAFAQGLRESQGEAVAAAEAIAAAVARALGGASTASTNANPPVTGSYGAAPRFASGVRNFAGGWAVVGERGPELVNLPGGSSVIPNGGTTPYVGSGGSSDGTLVLHSHVHLDGREIYENVRVHDIRNRRGGGQGIGT